MSTDVKSMHMGQITSFFIPTVTLVGQNCSTQIPDRLKSLGGKKPLIVTTNLTLTDLKNPQDVAHARIYDRLLSMCSPICFAGENLRQQAAAQKTANMRALMKSTA